VVAVARVHEFRETAQALQDGVQSAGVAQVLESELLLRVTLELGRIGATPTIEATTQVHAQTSEHFGGISVGVKHKRIQRRNELPQQLRFYPDAAVFHAIGSRIFPDFAAFHELGSRIVTRLGLPEQFHEIQNRLAILVLTNYAVRIWQAIIDLDAVNWLSELASVKINLGGVKVS
jgi:hypothetical protein